MIFFKSFLILMITLNEYNVYSEYIVQYNIEKIIEIIGIYIILWLMFTLNCVMISCWLRLFSDLFGSGSNLSLIHI